MRAYITTTACLFTLLAFAEAWQAVSEWPRAVHDTEGAVEAAIGMVAAALAVWAWLLLRARRRVDRAGAAA